MDKPGSRVATALQRKGCLDYFSTITDCTWVILIDSTRLLNRPTQGIRLSVSCWQIPRRAMQGAPFMTTLTRGLNLPCLGRTFRQGRQCRQGHTAAHTSLVDRVDGLGLVLDACTAIGSRIRCNWAYKFQGACIGVQGGS